MERERTRPNRRRTRRKEGIIYFISGSIRVLEFSSPVLSCFCSCPRPSQVRPGCVRPSVRPSGRSLVCSNVWTKNRFTRAWPGCTDTPRHATLATISSCCGIVLCIGCIAMTDRGDIVDLQCRHHHRCVRSVPVAVNALELDAFGSPEGFAPKVSNSRL